MAVHKATQYSVWCDKCGNLEDYANYKNLREAEKAWIKAGWKKINGLWICPECVTGKEG